MKTKLYKMWISFCKDYPPDVPIYNRSFNSMPEYYAWVAFERAIDPASVACFIFKNWYLFKNRFPLASIWLDMQQLDASYVHYIFLHSMIDRNALRCPVDPGVANDVALFNNELLNCMSIDLENNRAF